MKPIVLVITLLFLIIPIQLFSFEKNKPAKKHEPASTEIEKELLQEDLISETFVDKNPKPKIKSSTIFDNQTRYKIPDKYIYEEPAGEKRKGIREHLMIGVYSDFLSQYISKELPCSEGWVWQPSATIELYNFGVNFWTNFVLNDEPNQGQFNEIDITPYYNFEIKNFTIRPYSIIIVPLNKNPDSLNYASQVLAEADLHLQYKFWKMALFSTNRVRIKGNPGAYYGNLGIGFEQKLQKMFSIEASTYLSFGNKRYIKSKYAFNETHIDAIAGYVALKWMPITGFTVKPTFNFAVHILPSIRNQIRKNPDLSTYYIWGGFDFAYNF